MALQVVGEHDELLVGLSERRAAHSKNIAAVTVATLNSILTHRLARAFL